MELNSLGNKIRDLFVLEEGCNFSRDLKRIVDDNNIRKFCCTR